MIRLDLTSLVVKCLRSFELSFLKKPTADCTAHFIRTDLLTAGVTANLRKVTDYAARHEAGFIKLLVPQNEDGGK